MNSLLATNIVTGPVIVGAYVLSAVMLLYLLFRRPSRQWILTCVVALTAGLLVGVAAWFIVVRVNNTFGVPFSHLVYILFALTLACVCLAAANMWRSRWWRKAIAVCAVGVFLATCVLGINAEIGINYSLGTLLGVPSGNAIALPTVVPAPSGGAGTGPLWKTWKPPASMPAVGQVGTQVIPNTFSGFRARPAVVYLPPAALAPGAPPLPLVIMMMGQPGTPDAPYTAEILDKFAAKHNGLAPIVIVADQIGNLYQDPLCLNTKKFGKAKTYITEDVVNWALANLNVIHDHAYWTIAGYSNGGACAISFMAGHPELWSNVFDISGEEYPGAERPDAVLHDIFDGDQSAYDAIKPLMLLTNRKLPGTFGVFTVGSDDHVYVFNTQRMAAAAHTSGMQTFYFESFNGGHGVQALIEGLNRCYQLLYPRLGLSHGAP